MARRNSGQGRSVFAALALLLTILGLVPRAAYAHSATATITCSQVSFWFEFFPPSGINSINETISIDGKQVKQLTYQFVGSTSSNNVTIAVPAGTHTVAVHADWDGNGATMQYNTSQTITCECATKIPSMATAKTNGNAYATNVVVLGKQLAHSPTASSSRTGVGSNSGATGPKPIHLSGPIDVEVLNSSSSSSVTADGASNESVSTIANVNILNLVTATAVRADARAFASPTDARYSFAGSMIEGLTIAGAVVNGIYPNQVIPLPGGGTVTLLEEVATATKSGGVAKADIAINLIHVRLNQGNRLSGPTDIIVGHAEAHAQSPLATFCPNTNGSVGAEAFAASVSQGLNPNFNTIYTNRVSIPSIGGTKNVSAQTFQVYNKSGTPIASGTVTEQVNGIVNSTTARAYANATVESLCLFAKTPCDPARGLFPTDGIAVSLLTAEANSRVEGGQASSWTSGTTMATILINGDMINPFTTQPNKVYNLPGIGTVTVNETFADPSNDLTSNNGVRVNLIHVRTIPEGADIIISSARTEAHH